MRVPVEFTLRGALLVAAGGAVGSVLRYVVGAALSRGAFPWGTLAVNVLGSFAIALLLFGALGVGRADVRLLLATGVLGGFTTMSAFAFETVAFLEESQLARAAAYGALTVAGCIAAAFAGRWVAYALAA